MKYNKYFFLFGTWSLLTLGISCSGSKNDPEPEPEPEPEYSVTVQSSDSSLGTVYISSPGMTSQTIMSGGDVTLYAEPAENCVFIEWTYEDGGSLVTSSENPYTITGVTRDLTVTGMFEKQPEQGPKVIFEDDFEQESRIPDPEKWMLSPKGTSAWNRYNSVSYDQAYVEDGKLVLVGEQIDGAYKTGAVQMLNDLGVKYCLVEVNARFSRMAQGGWPAIWMMPAKPLYSGWPDCGEIDIMEHLNKDAFYYIALHTKYIDTLGNKNNPTYSTTVKVDTSAFNTYGMEWNEEELVFYLNGEKVFSYANIHASNESSVLQWPFDTTFYLILNQALGGADAWPGAITNSQLPAVFEVDWVKITEQ